MPHAFVESVAAFITHHGLLKEGATVLTAVSGGGDSMVCLSVLRRLDYDVHVLHANYGLREGADADEALVRRWCEEQSPSVPLTAVSLDAEARAAAENESVQEAARRLRYDALAKHAREIGAAAVATGHHRDDQAETLLLNLVRGSGPEGLAGMRPSRPMLADSSIALVRPLLAVSREEIEQYAVEEEIPWRTDPTNRSQKYGRGIIRSEILPLLEQHFEGAKRTIARSANLMGEYVDQVLRPGLAERMERTYEECEQGGVLSLEDLTSEPPVWRRRMVLEALHSVFPNAPRSYGVAEEIVDLVDRQVGRRVEVGGGTVWRERRGLRFVPDDAQSRPDVPTDVGWDETVDVGWGTLHVERLTSRPQSLDTGTRYSVYCDANRLGSTLRVRTWQDGDRIRPLGMDGSKKVSSLLTENDVPAHRRDQQLVVCTPEHIAWVVGHRLDRRASVRPDTESIVRFVFRPRENASDDCKSS